ncbi:MAG: hypothetical protein Q4F17_07855 [Eubacteriales bacterium]|nr:hypothetical protein [Eubacteriales bacterium]
MNGKDIFLGLSYIGEDLIDEAEHAAFPAKRRLSLKKPLLLAAVIAMAVMLVGCAAVYVLHLQDLKIGQQADTRRFDEYGKLITEQKSMVDVLTPHGMKDSPIQLAAQEWVDFTSTYDPDRLLMENENVHGIPDNCWFTYGCYTWDMVNKLEEITEKYGLKLLDKFIVAQRWEKQLMYDALGIGGVVRPEVPVKIEEFSGTCYPNGNFDSDLDLTLTENALWTGRWFGTYAYSKKDVFEPVTTFLSEDAYRQWNYKTADGTQVLLVLTKGGNGMVFADVGDATIFIRLSPDLPMLREDSQIPTQQALAQMADIFDYHVSPAAFDREALVSQLGMAEAERKAAEPVYLDPVYTDYGEFLNTQPWLDTLYYALYDLDFNGVEELLLGSGDGSFEAAYTVTDGQVHPFETGFNQYWLCQDGVLEAVSLDPLDPGYVSHQYFTCQDDTHLDADAVSCRDGVWRKGVFDQAVEISREEAQAALAKHPRMEIPFKSALDYPMNGTTLGEFIRAHDPVRTAEDIRRLYAEFAAREYSVEDFPGAEYTLMDVTGDGQEELLIRTWDDDPPGVFSAYRDQVVWIPIHGYLCENNVFMQVEEFADQLRGAGCKYYFWHLEGTKPVFLERLIHNLSSETWMSDWDAPEIPEAEAQAILAKYPRLELDMKPLSELVQ